MAVEKSACWSQQEQTTEGSNIERAQRE